MKYSSCLKKACLLFALLLGAGCASNTPQAFYYTLTSIEDEKGSRRTEPDSEDLLIGIGPVKFPDELGRPSIVTRSSRNQLLINEFHRWGGSLEKIFTRVIVDNMSFLMKTDHVMARPWERYFKPDIRIALDVHGFGGRLGEYGSANVTWMVFMEGRDQPVIVRRSFIKEVVKDTSYDSLVAAQSRVIGRLCRQIFEAVSGVE